MATETEISIHVPAEEIQTARSKNYEFKMVRGCVRVGNVFAQKFAFWYNGVELAFDYNSSRPWYIVNGPAFRTLDEAQADVDSRCTAETEAEAAPELPEWLPLERWDTVQRVRDGRKGLVDLVNDDGTVSVDWFQLPHDAFWNCTQGPEESTEERRNLRKID